MYTPPCSCGYRLGGVCLRCMGCGLLCGGGGGGAVGLIGVEGGCSGSGGGPPLAAATAVCRLARQQACSSSSKKSRLVIHQSPHTMDPHTTNSIISRTSPLLPSSDPAQANLGTLFHCFAVAACAYVSFVLSGMTFALRAHCGCNAGKVFC